MTEAGRESWEKKKSDLTERLEKIAEQDICVAFSGGADSSLLLYLARQAARNRGTKVWAVTFDTTLHPRADMQAAAETAAEAGVFHRVIPVNELEELPEIRKNPPDRCYLCKKLLYGKALRFAEQAGAGAVLDGTNADDLNQYRPGIRALRELNIESPLAEAGFSKKEVRRFAGELGIRTADRPASPCMATRLPYGAELDEAVLKRLEKAESALKEMGYRQVRARLHGEILRLEVEPENFQKAVREATEILRAMKALDFIYVTLDLEGFRSGSMDRDLTRSAS